MHAEFRQACRPPPLRLLPCWQFGRAPDPATGYAELVLRRSSENA
jgi:hypothetical protein